MDRDSGKASFRISCYMLELYCDDLADLLSEHKRGDRMVRGVGVLGRELHAQGPSAVWLGWLPGDCWGLRPGGLAAPCTPGCRVTVH